MTKDREKKKPAATRVAVIGLIGTVLTVCSGLAGAIVSGTLTIYQVERQIQQVALAPPGGERALTIDTEGISISRQQAAALDPESYFVDLDHGLAIHRPLTGWSELEELTVAEQLTEAGAITLTPQVSEQPVYRIRYGEPIEIQSDRQTLVNGQSVPEHRLDALEQLYGPPPWTQPYYSQVVVNVFEKSVIKELGIKNLADLLFLSVQFSGGQINHLIAEEGSDFMMVQASATYENVRMAGETATFTLETWLLIAEAEDAYYTVEIAYTPQSGQSVQVWDDLQVYMDSFRVIQ